MNKSNAIGLKAINTQDNLPVIYRNTSCELEITLTNDTGDKVSLLQNTTTLQVTIPWISNDEIKRAIISFDNWIIAIDGTTIQLTYKGENTTWANKEELTITISQLKTDTPLTTGNIQVNLNGFTPEMPLQIFTHISIFDPAKPKNALLDDVLEISLDNRGVIYISTSSETEVEELENELFLNIKNIGDTSLYTGTKKITPKIKASFVYGNSIGCLTPARKEDGGTYAWDIEAKVPYNPVGNSWKTTQPPTTDGNPCPEWVLEPEDTNTGLIGTGSNANITFSFSRIIAVTPPGHTQILLHFSGFWKDNDTAYNDKMFMLDIVKEEAPKERGIINFFSETPILVKNNPEEMINFTLKWTAFYTDRIDIIINYPVVKSWSIDYPKDHMAVLKDQMEIQLNGIVQDTAYLITIQAYQRSGTFLNSKQFAIVAMTNCFTDPRDGRTYPAIKIKELLWMAEDLKYETSQGSQLVEEGKPDRLYNWEAAKSPALLSGWRLPTRSDWKELIGSHTNSYEYLINGGSSGFDAILNGLYAEGSIIALHKKAFYWTSDSEGEEAGCATFNSLNKTVSAESDIRQKKKYYLAVRYVKNLNKNE